MSDTDFGAIPPYRKRSFVPQDADLTDAEQVTKLYRELLDREVTSTSELEQWLQDRSELEAALDQAGSILYVRMTCQTDDPARAEAYQDFVKTVEPAVRPLADQLDRKYLQLRERISLEPTLHEVYDRATRADVELFRRDNVPLQTELSLLSQEYQKICGAMTVQFREQEYTLPQMSKFLLEQDRPLRREAWQATTARRLDDRRKLDDLFDKMLDLRGRVASNADFENFRDYQFKAYHRFDYTPEDCFHYHDAVEKLVVPLWRDILQDRMDRMGVKTLRPWDTIVDPTGLPPLKPFETPQRLIDGVKRMFDQTDPRLGEQFADMIQRGLLDLDSRKGKAPGGYQTNFAEARKPFIFMNAVGVNNDVRTLLHEGGHAFHTLAAADQPYHAYRHAPMEFCEVASMSMELLAGQYLSEFYDQADEVRSRRDHLEGVIHILPWVATIDAFQHWIYENPTADAAGRTDAWLEIMDRFSGGVVDWSGLDDARAAAWQRQLHIFQVPFYYIEYGIAQLGALQVWVRSLTDRRAAMDDYLHALSLGGSRALPELFNAAGIRFDFSESTIAPLMQAVGDEIERLKSLPE